MIAPETKIRAFSSGWVLAMLLLLGGSAWMLSDLFDVPLPETSQLVQELREMKRAPDERKRIFSIAELSYEQKQTIYAALSPEVLLQETKVAEVIEEKPQKDVSVQEKAVRLPTLTGVIVAETVSGRPYRAALMDARRLQERQKIDGFQVASITQAGVVLVRGKKNWFVPVPVVHHTLNQVVYAAGVSEVVEGEKNTTPAQETATASGDIPKRSAIPALQNILSAKPSKGVS